MVRSGVIKNCNEVHHFSNESILVIIVSYRIHSKRGLTGQSQKPRKESLEKQKKRMWSCKVGTIIFFFFV